MARDLEAFAGTPDARAKLATQGAVPDFIGPQELAARIRAELATWRAIARSAGIKPE
jgi:tripartite-type tricarboxylate transporter receptor subunit TctC